MIKSLNLNNGSKLYACFPPEPAFTEDEVELWLCSSNEKYCIFKDSYHDVLLVESVHVIKYLETHIASANICFPKQFVDYCLGVNSDDSYINHLFAEYQDKTTWLTKCNNGNLSFEIWVTAPFSSPIVCKRCCSYMISFNEFLRWWNCLISLKSL